MKQSLRAEFVEGLGVIVRRHHIPDDDLDVGQYFLNPPRMLRISQEHSKFMAFGDQEFCSARA
jgi:hypothetical protein